MSTWRPQGWKTPATVKVYPYLDGVQPIICLDGEDAIIFEAGASAMLEALRERKVTSHLFVSGGSWVFIPGDKALDKTSN